MMINNIEKIKKIMKKTILENWFSGGLNTIDVYEQAITKLSMKTYPGIDEDWEKLLKNLPEKDNISIEDIYDVIYKYIPWNFIKYL
jgi:hypothetical protein